MVLTTDKTRRPSPEWLRSQWEKKKRESAARVAGAVTALRAEGRTVTYASIRERIHELYDVWISANTIKRNELAYPIYREHRQTLKAGPRREPRLRQLLDSVSNGERTAIQSKVTRLRREPKDALIAKLILLDQSVAKQKRVENALREEIIRLHQTTVGGCK